MRVRVRVCMNVRVYASACACVRVCEAVCAHGVYETKVRVYAWNVFVECTKVPGIFVCVCVCVYLCALLLYPTYVKQPATQRLSSCRIRPILFEVFSKKETTTA
jgi:hypothetical protein